MIPSWAYLDPKDREICRAVAAFLDKRLAEQGTIDWALKLKHDQHIERLAVRDLLNGPNARDLSEPWALAWRLIEESWSVTKSERSDGTAIYGIQKRLRAGDRSGAAVAAIVDLVSPRLKVEPIGSWQWSAVKRPRKPKAVEHILSASLTSGDLIDLAELELAKVSSIEFLESLASALEAAINQGLDIARRLGWDGHGSLWRLGSLARAYYVADSPRVVDEDDPDAFQHGIAPSVKLLHAVVSRISEIDDALAQDIVRRWRSKGSPVYLRLWAAMSRSGQVSPISEVTEFLTALDEDRFWDVHSFPEIAELRAIRFRDMTDATRDLIAARIQKGPPRDQWPNTLEPAKVDVGRLYWSLRELRRIEVGGGVLPDGAKAWLDAESPKFADLVEMNIDEGFPGGVTVTHVEFKADERLSALAGVERLKSLEVALGTGRRGGDDDPAERANNWISQPGNANKVLADFGIADNGGDEFPKVWNRFGWAHRPSQQDENREEEVGRVLRLLNELSDATLFSAIEGVCAWLDTWRKQAVKLPLALPIWRRLWPIAVEATNLQSEEADETDLSVVVRVADNEREPMDLDTLNTPAGKLVSVFFAVCPKLSQTAGSFLPGSTERQMRDIIIVADGRSGLISKHRMIEELPYFLNADPDWAKRQLILPLLRDDGAALALWRAVARRTHSSKVLAIIGAAMAERANDRRLGRETRRRLVFSLVIESLHAFREERDPAVPNQRIQQMLRTLDDEVRASAANSIQKFVHDLSAKATTKAPEDGEEQQDLVSAAAVFRSAAAPFLRAVWPQERSLATPGVSAALADLPATAGEAFPEAVDSIARFLVPFECWSMANYGLYGQEGESKKIAMINTDVKAKAFLRLLDLTVGHAEGSIIPYDLSSALEQIRIVSSSLANDPAYRRLETATRR